MFGSTKLARDGGPPAITIDQEGQFDWPILDDRDRAEVLHVLDSGMLSDVGYLREVEEDFARWLGVSHVLSHCNGTQALIAALHALGVQPGDEVLVQSATFWASATAIVHCGGVPVFVDIESECTGLDPAAIQANLSPRTKGVIVVHTWGMPSRMNEILEICRSRNLFVLEDASHAHGATYHDKMIGTLGDASVFSLHATKTLPAGEGGILATNRQDVHDRACRFAHYQRLADPGRPDLMKYAATGMGVNYRMSTLNAAVARTQLAKLADRNRARNHNILWLSERLERLGVRTFRAPASVTRVYYEYHVQLPEMPEDVAADVVEALRAEGAWIDRPRYPLLHQQPFFTDGTWRSIARVPQDTVPVHGEYRDLRLPTTEGAMSTLLRLPAFPRPNRNLVKQYARAFEKVLNHAKVCA